MIVHINSKSEEIAKAQNDFGSAFRLLVEGLRESKIGTIKYPDANSTLRLSYGKVRSLPADKRNDAKVNNYTTMDGLVKKYKKGDQEFDLPTRLIDMNKGKDYADDVKEKFDDLLDSVSEKYEDFLSEAKGIITPKEEVK